MTEETRTICIASDHAGYPLKAYLVDRLQEEGYKVLDFGTDSEESVDYPDFIHPVAKVINDGQHETAVIMCGSGNGAQMTANKYPNVRAALCWSVEQAELARRHNNANIISLPGRFIEFDKAWNMVKVFLDTEFEGGRHRRRIEKISKLM